MKVHHEIMRRDGWTEDEIKADSMQQFVTKSVIELIPGPKMSIETQRRWHPLMMLNEPNAWVDTGRRW